jgi:hypothetical protein
MAYYVWQLGIDWNAIQTGGVSYLRGGLTTRDGERLPGTEEVKKDDTVTFRIFDVSSSVQNRQVREIRSFGIDYQVAVEGQLSMKPLSNLKPTIGPLHEPAAEGSLFGNAYCSWDSDPVEVTATSGRFLLTVYLQAADTNDVNGVVRLFNHDPEMVVGPNG